jgi:hypothetical protein
MRHLRRKLEAYYREEGLIVPSRLFIPKGSYLPQFTEVTSPKPHKSPIRQASLRSFSTWRFGGPEVAQSDGSDARTRL